MLQVTKQITEWNTWSKLQINNRDIKLQIRSIMRYIILQIQREYGRVQATPYTRRDFVILWMFL